MSGSVTTSRVRYQEGQLLVTADLKDEQQYLVGRRRQHFAQSHIWGVATGLRLSLQETMLTISKGVAIDGFGRLLILTADRSIALRPTDTNEISIWLIYTEEILPTVPERVNEQVEVRLWNHAAVTTRQSEPGDVDDFWPVYLGALRKINPSEAFTVDTAKRPLIGLVGAYVQAASGSARVRCGEDFAVSVPGNSNGPAIDRLVVSKNGNLHIRASTALHGGLQVRALQGAGKPGRAGVGFSAPLLPGATAKPWQLYRTQTSDPNKPGKQQLVFEMQGAEGKEDPAALRTALGSTQNGKASAVALISSDGNVIVNGVLNVGGRLIESPIAPDTSDPRFVAAMIKGTGADVNVSANALAVWIEVGKNKDHTKFEYHLVFENKGPEPIQIVQAQVVALFNGQTARQMVLPVSNLVLGPHATHRADEAMTLASAGKVEIGIGVIGMLANKPVTAQNTLTVQVT